MKLLQERTVDDYVFRVDLRLRPDPGSTQIAVSIDTAIGYYESVGQNWERAALIKARPCAGDLAAFQHHIGTDRICETVFVAVGVADPGAAISNRGYNCGLCRLSQRIDQSAMNLLVERHR